MASKLGDREGRHDRFYKRAKEESFAARSVYKLEEVDRKYRLIPPGARVLDLGCRPGSWLQYASRKSAADPAGAPRLVGVDRMPLEIVLPAVRILVADIYTLSPAELLGDLEHFDVVLSDMAPDTTGVRNIDQARSEALFERALEIAESTLAPHGNFLAKLFQGPDWSRLIARTRTRFSTVKTVKPESSRKDSIEQYVVALGFA